MQKILLPDEDAEIGPVPSSASGQRPEPKLDRLSNILRTFNEYFGDIRWEDADRVQQLITEAIPARVAADSAFRNARQNSDRQNARIEHDKALLRVMTAVMRDDTELFKQFMDNASFKRWLTVLPGRFVSPEWRASEADLLFSVEAGGDGHSGAAVRAAGAPVVAGPVDAVAPAELLCPGLAAVAQ